MEAATPPSRAATKAVAASTALRPPERGESPSLRLGPLTTQHGPNIRTPEEGATLVEYGLMLALVALTALLAVTAFGIEVNGLLDKAELLDALS